MSQKGHYRPRPDETDLCWFRLRQNEWAVSNTETGQLAVDGRPRNAEAAGRFGPVTIGLLEDQQ